MQRVIPCRREGPQTVNPAVCATGFQANDKFVFNRHGVIIAQSEKTDAYLRRCPSENQTGRQAHRGT
jgi:hypothetical protein